MTDNPLLDFSGLPRFDRIEAAHVEPAVDVLLRDARRAVDDVAADTGPATWDTVVAPTEAAFDHLDRAWGAVRHLNAVVNTPSSASSSSSLGTLSPSGSISRLSASFTLTRRGSTWRWTL